MRLEGEWVLSEKIQGHEELLLEFVPIVLHRDIWQSLVSIHQVYLRNPHGLDLLTAFTGRISHSSQLP